MASTACRSTMTTPPKKPCPCTTTSAEVLTLPHHTYLERAMIDQETHRKLCDMRLLAMAETFLEVQRDEPGSQRTFGEKVGHMVDREWTARENRRLSRLLRAAKLTSDACMEDVWTTPGRGLAKPVVRDLASCRWIEHRHNVVCIGKT